MLNPFKRRHKPQGLHTPNLWSVWLVAPLALLTVGALAFGLYLGAETLLTSERTTKTPIGVQDVIKTTVTVITLMGAVLAGVYAYRKQLLAEGDSHRADASQLAERYSTAAEQLGHERPAVRLAGVYAMARLADDWPEQRKVCVDVLCAYLRMPYVTDPASPEFRTGEREVRLTIIRLMRDHLDPWAPTTWCGLDLDFTGAVFDGGDFKGAHFTGGTVSFRSAQFPAGEVSFISAIFSGATVSFQGAEFSGGKAYFHKARFTGGRVHFNGTQFDSGSVSFNSAVFSGSRVTFSATDFSGSSVSFSDARFLRDMVQFVGIVVSGGAVSFGGAEFSSGTIGFLGPQFSSGVVTFANARAPSDAIVFDHVQIDADMNINWGPFTAIMTSSP
ncbi:pentapeptide repeat-containing protein [Streptomyces sp. NPDC055006]